MSIAEQLKRVYDKTPEVYEAGRQAEYDDFWDKFQNNSNPTYCKNQFSGKGWSYNTFYPKYDIKPKIGQSIFQEFGDTELFSLTERLNECGVTLDTSQCTAFNYMFYATPFTETPHIDTRCASSLPNIYQISRNLKKASMTLKDDGSQTWTNTLNECNALEDFTIVSGAIGKNGFNVKWSTKLSQASLVSILEACNIDVTASPITITLPKKCIDGATDTEALLESLGGDFENTAYTYQASSLQLPHTNIKPNSISLIPVDENGIQTNPDWIDDGNGNIINPSYDNKFVGTINYATGFIDISSGAGYFGILNKYTKCQYTVSSPYDTATNINGYNIAFA